MSNYDLTPASSLALTEDSQIRAYIHPTRMAILELLAREKMSVSGAARIFGVHPANITHHFRLLEKVGLIKLVEKRETGRNMEKLYRAIALRFTVNMSGESIVNKQALALTILQDNLAAAIRSLGSQSENQTVFGVLHNLYLRPEDVTKFQQRLAKLLEEFGSRRPKDGTAYTVNLSFYPEQTHQDSKQEVIIRADDRTTPE
jgi:DNA-binding transcriptional ArsR family regulator